MNTQFDKKLVSVVITSYKRDIQLVEEAVNSVLNQTYGNLEIIIIDDNNPDSEYRRSLKEYAEANENIRYYPNAKNSGAQFSRNRGILLSKGEFVAFLDDDDLWEKTKIEKQVQVFERDEKVGLVFCDGLIFEETLDNITGSYQQVPWMNKNVTFAMELFNDFVGSTSQAIIKKECFAKVGLFDVAMPARQDYEMWLRISREYHVVGVDEKLFYHRIHAGERISASNKKGLMGFSLIYKKYREDYKKDSYSNAKMLMKIASINKKLGNKASAVKLMMKAALINPKCVYDVLKRKNSGQSFAEYYNSQIRKLSQMK